MPPAQPAQFTMPTIEARYANGPPTRGAQDLGSRLSSEEHEYILMRLRRGVSPPRIARELGLGSSTVRDARRDIGRCPSLLLGLRLFELAKVPGAKESRRSWWKCLLCGTIDTGGRQRSAGAGHDYVITVVGEMPRDIAERVSAAHASAIGATRSRHIPAPPPGIGEGGDHARPAAP